MKLKRVLVFLIILIILILIGMIFNNLTGNVVSNNKKAGIDEKQEIFVKKVVDGDTIKADVNGKEESIRLLGVNTPEKNKPYYKEAKDFLINEIENKTIVVISDSEDRDRYDRLLRYVFFHDRLINIEIIENGFATTFMLDDLKYGDKFVNGEDFARKNERGLWKKSQDKCSLCIRLVSLNAIEDYFIIRNDCDYYCNLSGWIVKDDANHFFQLNDLDRGEEKEYRYKTEVWNDDGDRFFMRDEKGLLVIFYSYKKV